MPLSISLTPQLEELVRSKIASGMYSSASEVVRAALRLLDEYDELRKKRLAVLRHDLETGIKSGRGRKTTARTIIRRARARKPARR